MSDLKNEIAKETEHLPEGLLAQILLFIRFLRYGGSTNAEVGEMPQQRSVQHLEEEFSGYQQQFPREQ